MNYQETLEYILGFTDYEKSPSLLYSAANYDLRRVEDLLQRLANPHLKARTVHIAGTKGKGSVAAMIASALCAAHHKTGLFTSPHLHTLRERIAVDGEPISEQALISAIDELRPQVEAVNHDGTYGQLTTFEVMTAAAFLYFRNRRVDFQVLEVGLGGRLDATNVVNPEICVITPISLDHVAILGDTVAKIAAEKAGIIKPGCVVVSSPQQPEAAEVIRGACRKKGVMLITIGNDITWQKGTADLSGQSLRVNGSSSRYELTIPLLGAHQLENAATAIAVLEVLNIPMESIIAGLAQVKWPGRLEVLQQKPLFVVDGAHNIDSARRLREAIDQYFDFDHLILIIGVLSDKDIAGIANELMPISDRVIVTRSRHPRSAEPAELANKLEKWGVKTEVAQDVVTAVTQAKIIAREKDLICATGSLFVVAEAREHIKGLPAELYSK